MGLYGSGALKEFDVVIIGAGPSGSSCGFFLDKKLNVLMLEKEKLPRNKVCGTGVLGHVFEVFGYKREEILRIAKSLEGNRVTDGYYVCDGERALVKPKRRLYNFCIPRYKLDYFFTKKALTKGVTLKQGEGVMKVEGNRVITDNGEYKGKIIVDASGVNSVLRKKMGITWNKKQVSLCYRVEVPYKSKVKKMKEVYPIDYGYGWVFPQTKKLNIGIGFVRFPKKPKEKWTDFINDVKKYSLYRDTVGKIPQPDAWMIPMAGPDLKNLVNERYVLVGDAGGFVNPIDGEGMYFGTLSGKLAATVINNFLLKGGSLEKYVDYCKEKIMPEIKLSLFLSKLLNKKRAGEIFINLMKTDQEFNKRFDELMEEGNYPKFFNNISLKLKFKLFLTLLRLVD
jgi:geranylgeranyl reductase family protein